MTTDDTLPFPPTPQRRATPRLPLLLGALLLAGALGTAAVLSQRPTAPEMTVRVTPEPPVPTPITAAPATERRDASEVPPALHAKATAQERTDVRDPFVQAPPPPARSSTNFTPAPLVGAAPAVPSPAPITSRPSPTPSVRVTEAPPVPPAAPTPPRVTVQATPAPTPPPVEAAPRITVTPAPTPPVPRAAATASETRVTVSPTTLGAPNTPNAAEAWISEFSVTFGGLAVSEDVSVALLNTKEGPSSVKVGDVIPGTEVRVLGRTPDGKRLKIRVDDAVGLVPAAGEDRDQPAPAAP
ncbi:hypothetical protein [Deinococcus sp. YIM 77859]|uniref:hypothetical protein n=1 Tax=Deinococcus sp. YIM 77859 TaxID=1540221 RepID=UPI000554CE08|nr:hypothetical protein [Deinococcus sp. YIM 77859]